MKKLFTILLVTALLGLAAVRAQDAVPNLITNTPYTPTISGALTEFKDAIFNSTNTDWLTEVHFLYAPALNDKYGGGIGYFYKANNYVLTGVRLDWVDGGFWMPSGNATLQLPLKPLKHFTFLPAWAQSVVLTPFGYAGIGIPLSGAKIGDVTVPGSLRDNNGQATAILGYGAALKIYSPADDKWNFSIAADRETWSGFPGEQFRFAILFHAHLPEALNITP